MKRQVFIHTSAHKIQSIERAYLLLFVEEIPGPVVCVCLAVIAIVMQVRCDDLPHACCKLVESCRG